MQLIVQTSTQMVFEDPEHGCLLLSKKALEAGVDAIGFSSRFDVLTNNLQMKLILRTDPVAEKILSALNSARKKGAL